MRFFRIALWLSMSSTLSSLGYAATGTAGASFLDIPVGAQPASLGSAYTAHATDAYAPVWNPAGLGWTDAVEVAATHLSYLQSVNYEFLGVAVPLFGTSSDSSGDGFKPKASLGASVQYLGSGDIDSYNDLGTPTGSFSSNFAAYSLAYGQSLTPRLSLGVTGKAILEKISATNASAYAADLGALYKAADTFYIGGVLANIGSSIKFVDESDPLPLAGRLGTYWNVLPDTDLSVETVYQKEGLFSGHFGAEWRYRTFFALRGGYDTSHTRGLSGASGLTGGIGIFIYGQEFSYAYVPYGDLGSTNYFTLTLRFSKTPSTLQMKSSDEDSSDYKPAKKSDESDYDTIYPVLSDDENKAIRRSQQPPSDNKDSQ